MRHSHPGRAARPKRGPRRPAAVDRRSMPPWPCATDPAHTGVCGRSARLHEFADPRSIAVSGTRYRRDGTPLRPNTAVHPDRSPWRRAWGKDRTRRRGSPRPTCRRATMGCGPCRSPAFS